MSYGRLSKKTSSLLSWRTRNWRLLDSDKFSSIERVDLIWSHRQAYWWIGDWVSDKICTDGWSGYERALPLEVEHSVSKVLTQRLERINGTLRQQTGRWHRRQNKFGKLWQQSEVTLRLVLSYFNWMWRHSCKGTTAALACRSRRASKGLGITLLPIPHFCRAWPVFCKFTIVK